MQAEVPLQVPPDHPAKTEFATGTAVNVTTASVTNAEAHVAPQSIPAGALERCHFRAVLRDRQSLIGKLKTRGEGTAGATHGVRCHASSRARASATAPAEKYGSGIRDRAQHDRCSPEEIVGMWCRTKYPPDWR